MLTEWLVFGFKWVVFVAALVTAMVLTVEITQAIERRRGRKRRG